MSKIIKKIYANEKQIKFLKSRAKRKTFHAGRGAAKTTTLGFVVGQLFENMPRARYLIGGLTYVQLDTIVLPGIRQALELMNYHEYTKLNPWGVYVVGVKPPDHWLKPYQSLGKLSMQYCISFINGLVIQFTSQDNQQSHRGINSDGLLIDESATIKEDFVTKVLLPTVRGNAKRSFSSNPLHRIFYDFSSASWTPEGMWIYKNEELYLKEQEQRQLFTPEQLKEIPPKHLFLESTYLHNKALPDDYGDSLRDLLDPLEFEVEVMNKRVGKKATSFYHQFDPSKHCYYKSYSYDFDDKAGIFLHRSNDHVEDLPLDLTCDFNANIVWGIVCQEVGQEARVINSKYVKPSPDKSTSIVVQLAQWFCDTYSTHPKKVLNLYGDPGGKNRTANTSDSNKTFFDEIKGVLIKNGWRVNDRVIRAYPRHKDKYRLVNYLLEEGSPRTPRIRVNQNTNKVLIIALQTADLLAQSDTFEKDKSLEKAKDQRQREYATDGTDALDYWLWPKYSRYMPTPSGTNKSVLPNR